MDESALALRVCDYRIVVNVYQETDLIVDGGGSCFVETAFRSSFFLPSIDSCRGQADRQTDSSSRIESLGRSSKSQPLPLPHIHIHLSSPPSPPHLSFHHLRAVDSRVSFLLHIRILRSVLVSVAICRVSAASLQPNLSVSHRSLHPHILTSSTPGAVACDALASRARDPTRARSDMVSSVRHTTYDIMSLSARDFNTLRSRISPYHDLVRVELQALYLVAIIARPSLVTIALL